MSGPEHLPSPNHSRSSQGPHDADGAALNTRVGVDLAAENAKWIHGLSPASTDHDHTVTTLYGILLKMAYTEARRKGARIQLAGPELGLHRAPSCGGRHSHDLSEGG